MGGDDAITRPLTVSGKIAGISTVRKRFFVAASTLWLAAAAPAIPADPATPVAHPYDETADAHAEVNAALAEAKRSGHTVLLDFGGNWCLDCRILAGILQEKPVQDWTADHFVVVKIDVGRRTKNMDIAQRFGVTVQGVPTVLMIKSDGTLLNKDNPYGLSDARSMTPQAVIDLLAKMART
jgi:thiol:disulfide interchange protein